MLGYVEKTVLPLVVFSVACVLIFSTGFVSIPVVDSFTEEFVIWGQIIGRMALALGLINLTMIYGKRIVTRKGNWIYYIVMFVVLVIMAVSGLSDFTLQNPQFKWLYQYVYTNCQAAFFGAVLFYLISCVFRVARIRSLESSYLVIAITLTILMGSPAMCSLWSGFPILGAWMQTVFNTGAFRGIQIGAAIGFVGLTVRMLIGKEKSWMGTSEGEE